MGVTSSCPAIWVTENECRWLSAQPKAICSAAWNFAKERLAGTQEAVNVGAVAVGEADEEEVAVYAARLEPCQSPSACLGVKQGPGDTCCGLLATSAGLAESSRWAGGLAGWAFFLGALHGFFLLELELAWELAELRRVEERVGFLDALVSSGTAIGSARAVAVRAFLVFGMVTDGTGKRAID